MKFVQTVSLGTFNHQKRVEFVKMKGPMVCLNLKKSTLINLSNIFTTRAKDMLRWQLADIGHQIVDFLHQIHYHRHQ